MERMSADETNTFLKQGSFTWKLLSNSSNYNNLGNVRQRYLIFPYLPHPVETVL